MNKNREATQNATIWVVFCEETEIPWLRFLKRGFRHCFAIMLQRDRWVSVDPLSHHMEVCVQDVDSTFDLPAWLQGRGHRVVPVELMEAPRKMAPILPFTCVEAVKRMIGMHRWTVITPWQLYKAITPGHPANT